MLNPAHGPTTVAILGENPVVGNALESLLRSADYAARFFPEYLPDSTEPFEGAKTVLLLPASSPKRNKTMIEGIRTSPATAGLRIIELITTPNEERNGHIRLPWPCSLQELKESIEAALPENPGLRPAD
jgi:hypothetical protein